MLIFVKRSVDIGVNVNICENAGNATGANVLKELRILFDKYH